MAASKTAVPSKPAAAPSLVAGGSAAQFNTLLGKTGAPAGGSSVGLSRLGQPAAGSKPVGSFTLLPGGQPKQGGMSWVRQQPQQPPAGKQPAPRQYTAAPALPQRLQAGQAQGTPGSALPKHMQSAAVPTKVGGVGMQLDVGGRGLTAQLHAMFGPISDLDSLPCLLPLAGGHPCPCDARWRCGGRLRSSNSSRPGGRAGAAAACGSPGGPSPGLQLCRHSLCRPAGPPAGSAGIS